MKYRLTNYVSRIRDQLFIHFLMPYIMQLKHIFSFLLLVTVLGACKKDSDTPEADVFYAVTVDGNNVTFNNTTTGAESYRWDFGDSTSSTEASPVHTYPGKGKYVPTLYATTKGGRVTEASTV